MWWLIGVVVVLAVLFVVLDRVAVRLTERVAVQSMEQGDVELTDAGLDIEGFPFLTRSEERRVGKECPV